MTEPPENAVCSASVMPPVRAALAVRTLAFVATRIPMLPARIENPAPTRKQTAVIQLRRPKPIPRNTAAAKTARILYCAFKNARAPSLIAAAICCILGVPLEILSIRLAVKNAKSKAAHPSTGAK
ncbi:unknown [Clostridium sp. CAG:1024]|nr:unknown [Clostridium sp. CAG:1024]